jgi:hypothetical protein
VIALGQGTAADQATTAIRVVAPPLAPPAAPPAQAVEPPANLPIDNTRAAVDLEAGFLLDPYLLRVAGGGPLVAEQFQEGCAGFVGEEPDVTLNWSGDSPVLYLYFYSDADPVLLVETPSGEMLCNDDAGLETTDPLIAIEEPAEGAYNIYVGTFRPGELALGFLAITEVEPGNGLATLSLTPLLARSDRHAPVSTGPGPAILPDIEVFDLSLGSNGVFGDRRLEAGFAPIEQPAAGGGDLPIAGLDGLGGECRGFVSLLPAYSFSLAEAGDLLVFFEALQDSTLLVVGPAGELLCNDNSGSANLNPLVSIVGGGAGRYVVYIGNHIPDDIVVGRLTITADTAAAPAQLLPELE